MSVLSTFSSRQIEIPSRRYGAYRIASRLGAGGQADVFLAQTTDESGTPLQVALKVMKAGVPEEVFAGEADLMGMLVHPNLVRRLEVGHASGRFFIAMEFLVAGDLDRLTSRLRAAGRSLPRDVALYVTIEVLRALAYFHQAATPSGRPLHLVHSDVTPSNVFFSGNGEVKLGDYGVAMSRSESGPLGAEAGVTAGKLHYLSPEHARGEPLTAASDLFSVGTLLHELLLGRHPFRRGGGEEASKVLARIRAGLTEAPRELPPQLATVLERALAPNARERFATAGEFAGALFSYALDTDQLATREAFAQLMSATPG